MKNIFTPILCFIFCVVGLYGQPVQIDFSSSSGQVDPNGTIDVDVRVSDFNNLVSAQMVYTWDSDVLEIESIPYVSSSLPGFDANAMSLPSQTSNGTKGQLRLAWISLSLQNESLPDDHLLFTMRFNAVGDDCDNTLFRVQSLPFIPIELADFDGNLYDLCTNTFVSQIKGSACVSNPNLTCNDQINISLDEDGQALIHPDYVLEGGPYDYTQISVVPSKVTCADDGDDITYTATDAVSGNTCFGTLTVEDKLGYCDGVVTGGNNDNLVCVAMLSISVSPWNPVFGISPESVLVGGPYDYTQLSISPDQLNCDNLGENTYTVTSTNGNSCWGIINYVDGTPPVAIAKESIVVSLTQGQTGAPYAAKVYIESIDNGSFDTCTEVDDLLFEPAFYEFDCSDIGTNIVTMTVTDESGNSNEVWTTILVELKIEGEGTCPEDVVVECTTDINDPAVIASTLGQGFVADGCIAGYSDEFGYDENGDGDTNDNFVYNGVTYTENFLVPCNVGVVSRVWETNDENGNDCVQLIYVGQSNNSFSEADIVWPEDQTVSCIDDLVDTEPVINSGSYCSLVGFTVNSDTLVIASDACSKIIQTFRVIDWCNYDPNSTTNVGVYERTVIIKIIDNTSPEVIAQDQVVSSCGSGGYRLYASVDDNNCRVKNVTWNVSIDANMDGSVDYTDQYVTDNEGTYFVNVPSSVTNSAGPHEVQWTVTDICGNLTMVTSTFTISGMNTDDMAPTPYCLNGLAVAVEIYDGSGPLPPPSTLFAKDIDAGSFDNCTVDENLRFTFSNVAPTNDPSYSSFDKSSSISFVEADLNGQNSAIVSRNIYVWDESNNSDFCTVNIQLFGTDGGGSASGDLTLTFSDEFAMIDDFVCMPLRVTGFEDINALQGTVSWDSDVLVYSSVQSTALPGMSEGNFYNGSDDKLSFVWIDNTGVTPATLSNGSVLFEVCFRVTGNIGDVSPVRLIDNPTPIELSNDNGELSETVVDGSVTVGLAPDCSVDALSPIAICISQATAILTAGSVELYAIDFNSNSYDNCTAASALRYTFTSTPPQSDPSYNSSVRSSSTNLTLQDANPNGDINLQIYIWDESNNFNSCLTTVRLVGDDNCNITEDDIIFPTALLTVPVVVTDPNNVSALFQPDALVQLAGIELEDAFPTYTMTGCANLFQTYNDTVFELGGTPLAYKIIREWTVLDWLTAEVYTANQIIKNYGDDSEYICDTLPRSAPIGDCDSGHTLEDDVEWPNDIPVSDHRITPDELVSVSGILLEDSRPIYYNEDSLYAHSYSDIINDLTQETLVIDRVWTVTRTDLPGLDWNYTQVITVDLREFGMLVTVNTLNNRPVPDVNVDGINTTNDQGTVYTEESLDPFKDDIANNGLNIRDIILMQAHRLSIAQFDELQLQAADINDDGTITNSDISAVRKVILGIDNQLSSEWTFVDKTNATSSGIDPKAHYVAIKPGDVDDSAVLNTSVDIDATETIFIEDILINEGASYSVPLYFGREINSLGAELHLDFNTDALDIRSVSATDAFGEISWSLDGDNRIVILNYNDNGLSEVVTTDTPILTIEFQAKQNGILKGLFSLSENVDSWIVTEDYGLLLIDGVFTGEIGTSAEDINNDLGIKVFPNPASEIVTIDMSSLELNSDVRIELFDMTGKLALVDYNATDIDVSNLLSGMYIYKLTIDDQVQSGKLLVKK